MYKRPGVAWGCSTYTFVTCLIYLVNQVVKLVGGGYVINGAYPHLVYAGFK